MNRTVGTKGGDERVVIVVVGNMNENVAVVMTATAVADVWR